MSQILFRVKQHAGLLRNYYQVFDPSEETLLYRFETTSFFGRRLVMSDQRGQEILTIEPEGFFWPNYLIKEKGRVVGEIRQRAAWFKQKLEIRDHRSEISVEGSFWGMEFTFTRGQKTIATVSKKAWSWVDSYGVEILDYDKPTVILAAVVVIDLLFFQQTHVSNVN